MKTRDPNILLDLAGIPMVPPAKILRMDLDDPTVWYRSPLKPESSATGHHGGGPNIAGEPVEEPTLTFRQKLAITFGRIKQVARIWESWHINSKGMSAIAYCTAIDIWGRMYRWRGHRYNGGQWGSINYETHAYVMILGLGQYATRLMWRGVGFLWFALGGPDDMKGHRDWNDDPRTKGPTSCPGDDRWRKIHDREFVRALRKLRYRRVRYSRGKRVLLFTARMTELGYMDAPVKRYRKSERDVVRRYQADRGLWPDGVVGAETWRDAALLDRE